MFQTQVGEPRTGREAKWYYEVYRGNQTGPVEFGELIGFDELKKTIEAFMTGGRDTTIFRVIGPMTATREQLDYIREHGGYPTFPG
jgi:hypothetical protein